MRFLTTWDMTDRLCYFYQSRADFSTIFSENEMSRLDASYMIPQP